MMHKDIRDLPEYWQMKVTKLRRECAAYRRERNEARRALDSLAEQVAHLLSARADG